MTYLLFFILFLTGFIKKDSKIIYTLTFIYMFILAGFNYSNADTSVYTSRFIYNEALAENTEILFTNYIRILKSLGLGFEDFVWISALIYLIAIFIFVYKHFENISLISSLYMLYSFAVDAVQVRNSLAFVFVLWGLHFLIKGGKKNTIIYIIMCLIATMIHSVSCIYLLAVFIPLVMNKKNIEYVMLGIVTFLLIFILFFIGVGLSLDLNFLPATIQYMLSHAHNDFRQIIVTFLKSIISSGLLFVVLNMLESNLKEADDINNNRKIEVVQFVRALNVVILPVFIGYVVSYDLYRIQRYLTILNLGVVAFGMNRKNLLTKRDVEFRVLTYASIGVNFYMFMINNNDIEGTLSSYLQYNLWL